MPLVWNLQSAASKIKKKKKLQKSFYIVQINTLLIANISQGLFTLQYDYRYTYTYIFLWSNIIV